MEKSFLLVHQISRKGHGDFVHLIAIDQIISITEIYGVTHIQLERNAKGKICVGIPVQETMETLCKELCIRKKSSGEED